MLGHDKHTEVLWLEKYKEMYLVIFLWNLLLLILLYQLFLKNPANSLCDAKFFYLTLCFPCSSKIYSTVRYLLSTLIWKHFPNNALPIHANNGCLKKHFGLFFFPVLSYWLFQGSNKSSLLVQFCKKHFETNGGFLFFFPIQRIWWLGSSMKRIFSRAWTPGT